MKLPKDWKSSAAGILSAIAGACGPLTAYLASLPHPSAWQVGAPGAITAAAIICRVWIGILLKDGGQTEAMIPGPGGSTITQMVPSHEMPDDPHAVPITKGNNQ